MTVFVSNGQLSLVQTTIAKKNLSLRLPELLIRRGN
jgi:hypothetical protein